MFLKYKMLMQEYSHGTTYMIYRRRWLFWYDYLGSISIDDNTTIPFIKLVNRLYGLGVTNNEWIIDLAHEILYFEKIKHECFEIIDRQLQRELAERLSNV